MTGLELRVIVGDMMNDGFTKDEVLEIVRGELGVKKEMLYHVRVTQEIPFRDYDEDGESFCVSSTGRIEEYVAGMFSAEHNAKLFAEALQEKIAEGCGYVTNRFTPRVSIIKIVQMEVLILPEREA